MKVLVNNKQAYYDFAIADEMTAGMVLSGAEVKSLKNGQASLNGAYVSVRGGEAFLVHAHISSYKYAGDNKGYNPEKDRKLLLNKKEIDSLIGKEKGLIIAPLQIFEGRKGLIKLKIGIGRGKKKYDKRESIKKRETDRRIRRGED
jgi:SsrA-binding protein